jgi:hypothetical protein
MPTHKPDLGTLSISQLAGMTGHAKETVARRLRAAGLEPARADGRTLWFVTRDALAVLYGAEVRRPGNGGGGHGGPRPIDFCMGSPTPGAALATMTGEKVCDLLGCDWRDVQELIGWGCPFVAAGPRRDSPRGWVFCFGHWSRWAGLMAQFAGLHDGSLAAGLRRIREAHGDALDVPGGFELQARARRPRGAGPAR